MQCGVIGLTGDRAAAAVNEEFSREVEPA